MPRRRRSVADIDRDARAVDLRRRNLTYRQIAREMGYSSVASAHEAVKRGLQDVLAEPADAVRQLEADRLDELSRTAWRVLHDRHLMVAPGGKVARHPETGAPLIDDSVTLQAIDRLLKIGERRAKLLGLDLPVQQQVALSVTEVTQADLEFQEMIAEERARREAARVATDGEHADVTGG